MMLRQLGFTGPVHPLGRDVRGEDRGGRGDLQIAYCVAAALGVLCITAPEESEEDPAMAATAHPVAQANGRAQAAVEFERVCKVFSRGALVTEAVRDLSFSVRGGEFVSIIGPSGCGKSTLLHVVGGFEPATSGRVLVDGQPVTRPGRDRGMVFQTATLFPWKSALKNVSWFLEVNGVGRREARARAQEYLELVGLSDFGDRYPNELSGGMRQRAALARTLALEPKVLLMDEPFGALDALTRETMQEELNRIWQQTATTVIFVTHDIGEAVFLSDRVVVFSSRPGRIVEDLRIDIARPRTGETKLSAELNEYGRHLRGLLHADAGPAGREMGVS